jgi:hypothetical protein
VLRRFRIQKCCSMCGKWELRDRTRRLGSQIFRLGSHAECVQRMTAIVAIEHHEDSQKWA